MFSFIKRYLIQEFRLFLLPIVSASENETVLREKILPYAGLPSDAIEGLLNIQAGFRDIVEIVDQLKELRHLDIRSFEDLKQLLDIAADIIDRIKTLFEMPSLQQAFVSNDVAPEDAIQQFLDNLFFEYLFYRRPTIFNLFVLLEIIPDESEWERKIISSETSEKVLHLVNIQLGRLITFLTNPNAYLAEIYWPNGLNTEEEAKQIAQKLFPRLVAFLNSIGLNARLGKHPSRFGLDYGDKNAVFQNSMSFFMERGKNPAFGFSIALSSDFGVLIVPFGSFSKNWLKEKWLLGVRADGELQGFTIHPNDTTQGNSLAGDLKVHFFAAQKAKNTIDEETGTKYVQFGNFVFDSFFSYLDKEWDTGLFFNFNEVSIDLFEPPSNGFLKKILPESKLELSTELFLGWTLQQGIHFRGETGLDFDYRISKNIQNGLQIKKAKVKARISTEDRAFSTQIGVYLGFSTSFLAMEVENLGVDFKLAFSNQFNKKLGPLDIDVTPLLPSGIKLSIHTSKFSGAGYISRQDTRYTGILQLRFSKLNLTAFGILDTELPDGREGYALLIMILAEGFKPVPLGLGFKLTGVGGLLAMNRSMNLDALRAGIKTNILDNILFPELPVNSAGNFDSEGFDSDALIGSLDQAFPVEDGRFVFGPMAVIQWGSPKPMLRIEMGLFVEVPAPVAIGIAGVLKTILPSEESRKLSIKVNFVGELDFEKKLIAFDAAIFDSRLMQFTLSGMMAFRLHWGEQPAFLLSLGGFHPKAPPPPVPVGKLDRIRIDLVNEKDAKVYLESYFAITSNTVQVGAKLAARFKAGKYIAKALAQFDVLFQFNPFRFYLDVALSAGVFKGAKEKLAIYIEFSLEGPAPWDVTGKAIFTILGVELPINVELTFGQERATETLPDVDVLKLLKPALKDTGAWTSYGLPGEVDLVKINVPEESDELILTPQSGIRIQQGIVPLNEKIEKFGNARPKGRNYFEIRSIEIGGHPPIVPEEGDYLEDYFAPNNFFELSDEEKLAKPSFDKYNNGIQFDAAGIDGGAICGEKQEKELSYEEILIDRGETRRRTFQIDPFRFDHLIGGATVITSNWSQRRLMRAVRPPIQRKKPKHKIVSKKDLSKASASFQMAGLQSARKLNEFLKQDAKRQEEYRVVAEHETVVVKVAGRLKTAPLIIPKKDGKKNPRRKN